MARALIVVIAFGWSFVVATASNAQEPQRRTSYRFFEENDDLPPDVGTDKNYTEAFRIGIDKNFNMFPVKFLDKTIDCAMVVDKLPERGCIASSIFFGQQFYTPDDITISQLIPNDRPYAGWLYVGAAHRTLNADRVASTEVIIGITGKAALARPVQTRWHQIVGAPRPEGWSNQIGGRLGFVVNHERRIAFDATHNDKMWLEITPFVGGSVGNIVTWGYSGAQLKVGYNLTRDWGHLGITPRVDRDSRLARSDPGKFEIYLIADMSAKAVAYNVFLDAANQHTLDRYGMYADSGVGAGIRIKNVTVSYRTVFIGPEYRTAQVHTYRALRVVVGALSPIRR